MPLLALFNNPVQNNSSYIWTLEYYFVLLYQITHQRFCMKFFILPLLLYIFMPFFSFMVEKLKNCRNNRYTAYLLP